MRQYLTVEDVRYVGDACTPVHPSLFRIKLNRLVLWADVDYERLPNLGQRILVEWQFNGPDALKPTHVTVMWPWDGAEGGKVPYTWRLGYFSMLLPSKRDTPPKPSYSTEPEHATERILVAQGA
jgi:hypothetical protein